MTAYGPEELTIPEIKKLMQKRGTAANARVMLMGLFAVMGIEVASCWHDEFT